MKCLLVSLALSGHSHVLNFLFANLTRFLVFIQVAFHHIP